ncbi:MAG TPA: hypothetical protein VNN25_15270 [Thermoanaerobaculia bacterium]|nr:hypothetical protein [Thermoanaerobaculia bacterium]
MSDSREWGVGGGEWENGSPAEPTMPVRESELAREPVVGSRESELSEAGEPSTLTSIQTMTLDDRAESPDVLDLATTPNTPLPPPTTPRNP